MKGISKFLTKGAYLILSLVIINIFLFEFYHFKSQTAKIREGMKLREASTALLDILTTSEQCLAYEENIGLDGVTAELGSYRILDAGKITDFVRSYPDIEPDCARSFDYGYLVKIEKFDLTRIDKEIKGEIPKENRDMVFIMDATRSMQCSNKMDLAISAASVFIDCASDTDRVGLVTFYDCNDVRKESDLIQLTPDNRNILKNKINAISYRGATAIRKSIEKATEILDQQSQPGRYKMIVLLTDGCDTCDVCLPNWVGNSDYKDFCKEYCTSWEGYCGSCPGGVGYICDSVTGLLNGKDIHVFPIGFFTEEACTEELSDGETELKCIADRTGGEYYRAISGKKLERIFCEIAGDIPKPEEYKENWYFGSPVHSEMKSLDGMYSVSLPISIRFSDTKIQPGRITIYLYDGELEKVAGLVDKACLNDMDLESNIILSYKTSLTTVGSKNMVCMNIGKKKICRTLACKKDLSPKDILPGFYKLDIKGSGEKVHVRT